MGHSIKKEGDLQLIKLSGKFLGDEGNELRYKIFALVQNKFLKFIVDLDELTFIDSSGITALVLCLKHIKDAGGKMILTRVSESITREFETTRLDDVFTITDTMKEAKELV